MSLYPCLPASWAGRLLRLSQPCAGICLRIDFETPSTPRKPRGVVPRAPFGDDQIVFVLLPSAPARRGHYLQASLTYCDSVRVCERAKGLCRCAWSRLLPSLLSRGQEDSDIIATLSRSVARNKQPMQNLYDFRFPISCCEQHGPEILTLFRDGFHNFPPHKVIIRQGFAPLPCYAMPPPAMEAAERESNLSIPEIVT